MQRIASSWGVRAALTLVVSALLPCMCGCTSVAELLQQSESIRLSYPELKWNEDDPEATILQLETYLQRLEKRVIITGGRELEWEDVCRRCYWVDTFVVSEAYGNDKRIYEFTYLPDADKNKLQRQLIDKEVSEIVSCIPAGSTEWEAVVCVHDELIRRVTYTDDDEVSGDPSGHIYDLYGALVDHKAVCQGYVYAMDYILDELNISYEDIISDTHIWSRLPDIDGCEKYIDVTWDDIDETDRYGEPYILHNCLYISAKEIGLLDEHQVIGKLPPDGKATGSNYFRTMGGLIPAGQTELVSEEISRQYNAGTNMVQLRFETESDYDEVHDNIEEYVYSSDYGDSFALWNDKELLVLSIGLYFDE